MTVKPNARSKTYQEDSVGQDRTLPTVGLSNYELAL
jgi:hypothetical protein